jgi:hypothetical protein
MLRKTLLASMSLFLLGCSLANAIQTAEPPVSLATPQSEELAIATPETSEMEIPPTVLPSIPDECGNP